MRHIDPRGTWTFSAVANPRLHDVGTSFRKYAPLKDPDDGLIFARESVSAQRIKEEQQYEGVRVKLLALLENARILIQVDV